jgi:hypothetical protein
MKLTIYGPARDGEFSCWIVYGPRGGEKAWFYTKKAAEEYVRRHK